MFIKLIATELAEPAEPWGFAVEPWISAAEPLRNTFSYLAAEPLKDFSGFAAQVCLTRVSIRSSVYYSCVCMT